MGDLLLNDPNSSPELQFQVVEKRLHSAATYMLNIPMRYEFEDAFYARRTHAPLSATELCELMHQTQVSVYERSSTLRPPILVLGIETSFLPHGNQLL